MNKLEYRQLVGRDSLVTPSSHGRNHQPGQDFRPDLPGFAKTLRRGKQSGPAFFKFFNLFLTVLILVLLIMPTVSTAATNYPGKIFNAGFEEGDKLPAGWVAYPAGLCVTLIWDNMTAHTGQKSVYVCNMDREGSGAWGTSCKVKENTPYRFAAWVKIKKGTGQGITVLRARGHAKGMDKDWEAISEGKGDTGGKWELMELVFTTPPGMEKVSLSLWNINGRGDRVWFDDVEFSEVKKYAI